MNQDSDSSLSAPTGVTYARALARGCSLIALAGALFALWLLTHRAGDASATAANDVISLAGEVVALILSLLGAGALWRRSDTARTPYVQRAISLLIALWVLGDLIAQAIYVYYDLIARIDTPGPSWADAAYLSSYPFLLAGVLLLPTRPLRAAVRARIVLDGLMLMAALATCSWYFIFGPIVLHGRDSALDKVVNAAYPLADLVLIFCLVLLWGRVRRRSLQPIVWLLSVGLALTAIADSIYDVQVLHGAYITGEMLDAAWPVSDLLIGLAALLLRPAMVASDAAHGDASAEMSPRDEMPVVPSALHAVAPFVLAPLVGVLVYVAYTQGPRSLAIGVYTGGALMLGLILLRQALAMLENRGLYAHLHEAYLMSQASNHALAQANAQLETLAITDPLTGLPNHRALIALIDAEMERTREVRDSYALLFIDLDHFKALNDSYGHRVGDAALREIGRVIGLALRATDVLGRWGGEEFVAVLPEVELEAAAAIAERVRLAVAGHAFVAGGAHLTCSLGVAAYPADADDRDGLVTAADKAMYAAKRLGRNQVRVAGEPAVVAMWTETGTLAAREETALAGTVEALAALIESRDSYTGRHTGEVARLAVRIALALGLDSSEAQVVGLVGRLHDVGKVSVPDSVLHKPAALTEEEWTLMRTHPSAGAEVVSRVPVLRALAPLVRAHHERWDGAGYPDSLAGREIPLGARIVAVADAFDAMITDRPYRAACSYEVALRELRRCAGTQFDPAVVEALERVIDASTPPAAAEIA